SPQFATMNLAQSVAIFCYELAQGLRGREVERQDLPPGNLLRHLHEHAQRLLLEAGYLHESNPHRIYDELRALAGRAQITTREASLLLALIRQIEWKIGATKCRDQDPVD
ncbi:MAG TPA: hypothetical protein VM534_10080, partial [Thermoanaerobaculia bacterium]|nr:hypothetical protein [Thermoanaerobaculia bacterium]